MPRPKCRIEDCPEAAREFPDIIFVNQIGPASEHREVIALCTEHHDEYQAGTFDHGRIGDVVMLDE